MSTPAPQRMTVSEYLAFERVSDVRHEFYEGQVFAMAGGSREHSRICVNIVAMLHAALGGSGCEVYESNLRVKVSAEGLYTYPDAAVACGDQRFEDDEPSTLLNPVVIFEVLSPSSEAYDRGRKFQMYMKLESLREYVLVSQEKMAVEHFVRQESGSWLLTVLQESQDELNLTSCEARLPLRAIYDRVEFPAQEPAPPSGAGVNQPPPER